MLFAEYIFIANEAKGRNVYLYGEILNYITCKLRKVR
jgi:hypothetical protein